MWNQIEANQREQGIEVVDRISPCNSNATNRAASRASVNFAKPFPLLEGGPPPTLWVRMFLSTADWYLTTHVPKKWMKFQRNSKWPLTPPSPLPLFRRNIFIFFQEVHDQNFQIYLQWTCNDFLDQKKLNIRVLLTLEVGLKLGITRRQSLEIVCDAANSDSSPISAEQSYAREYLRNTKESWGSIQQIHWKI